MAQNFLSSSNSGSRNQGQSQGQDQSQDQSQGQDQSQAMAPGYNMRLNDQMREFFRREAETILACADVSAGREARSRALSVDFGPIYTPSAGDLNTLQRAIDWGVIDLEAAGFRLVGDNLARRAIEASSSSESAAPPQDTPVQDTPSLVQNEPSSRQVPKVPPPAFSRSVPVQSEVPAPDRNATVQDDEEDDIPVQEEKADTPAAMEETEPSNPLLVRFSGLGLY